MKKLTIIAFSLLFLAACSPEKIINMKLKGTWNVTTINGQPLPDGISHSFTFKEGKRFDGKVTENITTNDSLTTNEGIYSLYKSASITMAFSSDPNVDTRRYDYDEISKSEIKLHEENNPSKTIVLNKK